MQVPRRRLPMLSIAIVASGLTAHHARAVCDVIPQSPSILRAASGSVDRPYASPADKVRVVRDAAGCDAAPAPPLGGVAVTLFFKPPGGPVNAVSAVDPLLYTNGFPTCTLVGGGTHHVQPLAGLSLGADSVTFPFPDTDAEVAPAGDGFGLTGPVVMVVQYPDLLNPAGAPCALETQRCADTALPGDVFACVDELYESDGTCSTEETSRGRLFSHFTALPPPNPFHEMCTSTDPNTPCTGSMPAAGATLDDRGNLLIPFLWAEAVLPGDFPTPRLVRVRSDAEAFPGGGAPIDPPGPAFYDSFTLGGRLLPPFFEEFADPTSGEPSFVGSIDAPRGVVRLLRRSPVFRECHDDVSGNRLVPGVPCTADTDCPGGSSCGQAACYLNHTAVSRPCASDRQCDTGAGEECGPSIFDFSTRALAGTGPLVITSYEAEAQNPVPFDGLLASDQAILSVRSEPLENDGAGADLNADADAEDVAVVSLRRPDTGETLELGGVGVVGPATTRVEKLPLELPAIALEGDRAAFLLKLADEGSPPGTDFFDTTLSVTRVDPGQPGGFVDETPVPSPGADPAPLVNDRPLVVSNGRIFFRTSEPLGAPRDTWRVDQTSTGAYPDDAIHAQAGGIAIVGDVAISDDGRWVAFSSAASEVGGHVNATGNPWLYVLDRDGDGNGVYDEPGGIDFVLGTSTPQCESTWPDMSGDGRFIAYQVTCHLSGWDPYRALLWDRDGDENGVLGDSPAVKYEVTNTALGDVFSPSVSDDGSLVAFQTTTAIAAIDTNGLSDVYLRDMSQPCCGASAYTLVMNNLLGQVGNGPSVEPELSGDGKALLFTSKATNLEAPAVSDGNGTWDVFARGPNAFLLRQISVRRDANGNLVAPNGPSRHPSTSRDGRVVVFSSSATDLPGGDALGQVSYVVDRDVDADGTYDEGGANQILPVSMSAPGFASFDARGVVSPDGRWVATSGVWPAGGGLPVSGLFDRLTRSFLSGPYSGGSLAMEVALPTALSENANDRVDVRWACNRSGPPFFSCTGPPLLHGFVGGIDRAGPGTDANGDGDLLDSVLSVYDPAGSTLVAVAAAEQVAVAGDLAAFLLPERAESDAGRCAAVLGGVAVPGGCDLNGDADADDLVVHLYDAASDALQNLGLAALDVAVNADWVLARADTGGTPQARVHSTAVGGSWVVLDDAVEAHLHGQHVALRKPGSPDVARLFALSAPAGATAVPFVNDLGAPLPDPSAVELVLGDEILALRSLESAEGDMNGDGDAVDAVMQVAVLATGRLFDTGQAAAPCPVEACDPNEPYRVDGQKVVFITREVDQSGTLLAPGCLPTGTAGACDLDGDGDADDFLVQYYNAAAAIAAADAAAGASRLASTTTGVCTDSGEACFDDAHCLAGICLVPPGICAGPTATACNPDATGNGDCASDQFCDPTGPTTGICFQYGGSCTLDADCAGGETCRNANQELQTLANPLEAQVAGGQRQLSQGVCVEPTALGCPSRPGGRSAARAERSLDPALLLEAQLHVLRDVVGDPVGCADVGRAAGDLALGLDRTAHGDADRVVGRDRHQRRHHEAGRLARAPRGDVAAAEADHRPVGHPVRRDVGPDLRGALPEADHHALGGAPGIDR